MMINFITTTFRLFCAKKLRKDHKLRVAQMVSTLMWTAIAVCLMAFAVRHLLPGMVYAATTAVKYLTQGIEAHDMMSGVSWELADLGKKLVIERTWMGGFLNTIHAYNLLQISIEIVCFIGFGWTCAFMDHAWKQFKSHFGLRRKRSPKKAHNQSQQTHTNIVEFRKSS